MAIIEINELTFQYRFGDTHALNQINLSIDEGEFLVIMGPVGAGKSTLCLCLNGIVPQRLRGDFQGSVIVSGENTLSTDVGKYSDKIGMVFQNPETQLIAMTVAEEVAFAPENLGIPREEIISRMDWALDSVRLNGLEKRFPFHLSGGQKQRLAIAAAIATRPPIIVFDEPTSELDPLGKEEVFEVIQELKHDHDVTVVMVENTADWVAQYADRIVVLDQGRIKQQGSPRNVFKDRTLFKNIGIELPQVTEAAFSLGIDPEVELLPLSIKEAYSYFTKKVSSSSSQRRSQTRQFEPHTDLDDMEDSNLPVIEVENVNYEYTNDVKVLKDVSLKVYAGERIAIVGQNGSGKTTLAKHLNGLLLPSSGSVRIMGLDTRETNTSELARKCGYCFQNPDHQIFEETIADEIRFGPRNLGLSENEIEERLSKALQLVGLVDQAEMDPFLVGRGMRQKVAVASILALEPDILMIDEPTTGLTFRDGVDVLNVALELSQKGKTLIVISHDINLVAEFCQRVIVLNNGKVIMDGKTNDILSRVVELRELTILPPQITLISQELADYGFNNKNITVRDFVRDYKKLTED